MWCISVASSVVLLANDFICLAVASLALHMLIAFWIVKSGSFSSLLQFLSHWILQTIPSRIKPYLRSWDLHVHAFLLGLQHSGLWFHRHADCMYLSTCVSQMTFVHGMQWPFNISRIISTFCLSSLLAQVNMLYAFNAAGPITCRRAANSILASFALGLLASINS